MTERPITDAELLRYGYRPGLASAWCATCGRTFQKANPLAFKCRVCASQDFRLAERDCMRNGLASRVQR